MRREQRTRSKVRLPCLALRQGRAQFFRMLPQIGEELPSLLLTTLLQKAGRQSRVRQHLRHLSGHAVIESV